MLLKQPVIQKIKQYRQGVKTVHELYQELKDDKDLQPLSDAAGLPVELMSKVGLSAFNCEELYELPNAVASRAGLIHLLEEFLADRLTIAEINDWGENQVTWEIGTETEDETVDLIAGNIIAQCDVQPEEYFTKEIVSKLLEIIKLDIDRIKERVAVHLAFPRSFKSFCYYTADYKQKKHTKEDYEKYIEEKFWMKPAEFPYWKEIESCGNTIAGTTEMAEMLLKCK